IRVDGINHHLGYFDREEDAARAYNTAAVQHFGEFARINDISPGPAARNIANAKKLAGTSSCFKGVSWRQDSHKWRAEITHHGVHYYLGRFDREEDAARAYDSAQLQHFGES